MKPIDFHLNRHADGLLCGARDCERILRAFLSDSGVTVVDAMPPHPEWEPVTVYLGICGPSAEGVFPVGRHEKSPENDDILFNMFDTAVFDDDLDDWYFPDGTRVVRVDFDLEDGAIETARDVTEDFGVVTETDLHYILKERRMGY